MSCQRGDTRINDSIRLARLGKATVAHPGPRRYKLPVAVPRAVIGQGIF